MPAVQLFAALKEALGAHVEVELPGGATATEVLASLAAAYPAQAGRFERARLAADEEFLAPDAVVPEGAVLAVIPPVSGG